MKFVAIVLGLLLLAAAVAYFVIPAGQLPEFIPGFEAGSEQIHTKHGLAALVGAIVLFAFAWYRGRAT